MRQLTYILLLGAAAACGVGQSLAASAPAAPAKEQYVRAPLPPGIQVIDTELEGPVFADAKGKTLYKWPYQSLRAGYVGDEKGRSACTDTVTTTSQGLFSPYPPGLVLPHLDTRPSCVAMWPPVIAPNDAKPVDKWTVIARQDGSKQWAYDGQALYTSVLDRAAGDVLGGTNRDQLKQMAGRYPVGPPPQIPPGFTVVTTFNGRLLVNSEGYSVYASDQDAPDKSNCRGSCEQSWAPVKAPALAQSGGEWSIVERAPGVRQWAFRKKPLYTHTRDTTLYSQLGSDVPGWHNVYTQQVAPLPKSFQTIDTQKGVAVADSKGRVVYVYLCSDDSFDQLSCDYPGSPPEYRIAICGGGDVDRCLKTWPYVTADANAKSDSKLWSVIEIEPRTGRLATAGEAGSVRVWAYRGSPIYTFADDTEPGDVKGDQTGEMYGQRNGFTALWVRDDFYHSET
jgi:predicted lipoprotein with Yx(FWY)xxD motif